MKDNTKDLLHIAFVVSAIMFCLYMLFQPAPARAAQTSCDEWANFTKIITFRFRDNDFPQDVVKKELNRVMGGAAEIETAQALVDYAYANKDLDAVKIWEGVFAKCMKENSI